MSRILAAVALAAVAFAPVAAHADPMPGGRCEGNVDLVCNQAPGCTDLPCNIEIDICLVWLNGACKVG